MRVHTEHSVYEFEERNGRTYFRRSPGEQASDLSDVLDDDFRLVMSSPGIQVGQPLFLMFRDAGGNESWVRSTQVVSIEHDPEPANA